MKEVGKEGRRIAEMRGWGMAGLEDDECGVVFNYVPAKPVSSTKTMAL